MPKLMYLLRSSPTFQHPDLLAVIYDLLKSCATDICNVSFDDIGWIQATLPIRLGSIGLLRVSVFALPAYLASISASQSSESDSFCLSTTHVPWIHILMCGHQPTHLYLKTRISNVSGTTSSHLLALLF